jgi:putative transcriptional regulator
MKSKNKSSHKSEILDVVHETARGLHCIGLIDKKKMDKFDLLCLAEVPNYTPSKIKTLRKRYNISQAVLAAIINTSLSTVRQREIGDKHPSGPSRKLLSILDTKGLVALI